MIHITTNFEMFEFLVQKAHDTYGPLLPLSKKNELEQIAEHIGYDGDIRSGYDYGNEFEPKE